MVYQHVRLTETKLNLSFEVRFRVQNLYEFMI